MNPICDRRMNAITCLLLKEEQFKQEIDIN